MESVGMIQNAIQASFRAIPEEASDYREGERLYCGICRTPKEMILPPPFGQKVRCLCRCAQEKQASEERQRRKQEEADKVGRLRAGGIASPELRKAVFACDDGTNPEVMAKLRRYAENWEKMEEANCGLLLYGAVGTGKSFGAACVANYLIDRNIPVFMGNLGGLLNDLHCAPDKNAYIRNLMAYPLLIIDDFGIERQTEYAQEQVYHLINERYLSGKPMIVTTNLSETYLRRETDLTKRRIFDRVLEMCPPLCVRGANRREAKTNAKRMEAASILANP